jgi:hypothetical protein
LLQFTTIFSPYPPIGGLRGNIFFIYPITEFSYFYIGTLILQDKVLLPIHRSLLLPMDQGGGRGEVMDGIKIKM